MKAYRCRSCGLRVRARPHPRIADEMIPFAHKRPGWDFYCSGQIAEEIPIERGAMSARNQE